jgi:hypothetical protein
MTVAAGYTASVLATNDSASVTDDGMTDSGDGLTFYTTTAAHNWWDPTVTPTFKANGGAISSSDIEEINYLLGKVTFATDKTGDTITWSGDYVERHTIALCRGYDISFVIDLLDKTVFGDSARNRHAGLKDVQLGLNMLDLGLDDLDSGGSGLQLYEELNSGNVHGYEIQPPGAGDTVWRAWLLLGDEAMSFSPDELQTAQLTGEGVNYGASTSLALGDPTA